MELLFDTPWWLPTAAIGTGIFVWYSGNNRQEKPVMRAGIAIAVLGVVIVLISYFVQTPREKAIRRTYQLVAAVDQHDWPTFQALVDPQTSIYGLRGPQEITQAIRSSEQFRVTSARITGLKSDQADTIITITIRVLSEQMGRSGVSDWQLQYQNLGQGWVLYTVRRTAE